MPSMHRWLECSRKSAGNLVRLVWAIVLIFAFRLANRPGDDDPIELGEALTCHFRTQQCFMELDIYDSAATVRIPFSMWEVVSLSFVSSIFDRLKCFHRKTCPPMTRQSSDWRRTRKSHPSIELLKHCEWSRHLMRNWNQMILCPISQRVWLDQSANISTEKLSFSQRDIRSWAGKRARSSSFSRFHGHFQPNRNTAGGCVNWNAVQRMRSIPATVFHFTIRF